MLKGIQAEIGEMRRGLARGIHAEDTAGLFRGVVVGTGIGYDPDIGRNWFSVHSETAA
jgi:hypothetical protein